MGDVVEDGANRPLWLGLAFALVALLSNLVFFLNLPMQRVIPWISLLLAVAALAVLSKGLRPVFNQPQTHRRKLFPFTLAAFSLLLVALSIVSFFRARAMPTSAEAPKIGQTAPDFTLTDTNGQPVSLAQLLTRPDDGEVAPPRAVLLVFYRGSW